MASEAQLLRDLAQELREKAAAFEQAKTEKIGAVLQASRALVLLKEKLSNVR